MKSRGLALAAAPPALVVAVALVPAHAATGSTGWRVVLTRHYGAASNNSAYETVTAPAAGDAWVFGGTSVSFGNPAGNGAPVAEHWNGVKWAPSALPAGLAGDVSASAAVSGTWRRITAPVLSRQGFSGILALAKGSVWALTYANPHDNPHLVHLSGGKWSSVRVPWRFDVALPIAPDGSGGFWFAGFSSGRTWAVHRTSAGAWSRTERAGTPDVVDLALVPGTTSLWGASWTPSADGANAQILAYGPER